MKFTVIFLFLALLYSGCGNSDSGVPIVDPETRVVSCSNQKPVNSSWSSSNPGGKLTQTYSEEFQQFLPSADSCGWVCDNGFYRYGNSCAISQSDSDGDGVWDAVDNCPAQKNSDQNDLDLDNIGDLCDDDLDGDGLENTYDNCPDTYDPLNECNQTQPDRDHDSIPDSEDNCPDTYNPLQNSSACATKPDRDKDGIPDESDNCPSIYNPEQNADACETKPDRDKDGVPDESDNCPDTYNPAQNIDACQAPDRDKDGIPDSEDNCPDTYNPAQNIDACQAPDRDNDGVPDGEDNCPDIKNPDQKDSNNNGVGDLCDQPDGSQSDPFIIDPYSHIYRDQQNTQEAPDSLIDSYPPNDLNQSGREYYYRFTLEEPMFVEAYIDERQQRRDDVDIDLHLLSSISPLQLISRGHLVLERQLLQPGTYYIVLDSYYDANIGAMEGFYHLNVKFSSDFNGTSDDPIDLSGNRKGDAVTLPLTFTESRSTADATSDIFDTYAGFTSLDESGNEFIYSFTIDQPARVMAMVAKPEPSGVDIDIHLLGNLDPDTGNMDLIDRGDFEVYGRLQPGTYFIIADSYKGMVGDYELRVAIRPVDTTHRDDQYFNYYMMEAIHMTDFRYRLLGYDSDWLTHDKYYGDADLNSSGNYGEITMLKTKRTMCVAAVWEIMLTAMELYVEDYGDYTIYEYLPLKSWKTQNQANLKGHIWVNHSYSHGTADAVTNFGMGEHALFPELAPGSVLGITRSTGTGHAVVFVAFVDKWGFEYDTYPTNQEIIGFKYYSSQGGYNEGNGGMDYRYAIFTDYHTSTFCDNNPRVCDDSDIPYMPYRVDRNVYYHNKGYCQPGTQSVSDPVDLDRGLKLCRLNTGYVYGPTHWNGDNAWCDNAAGSVFCTKKGLIKELPEEQFNADYFTGETYGDTTDMKRPNRF